jgi:hypothetical protein
VNHTYISNKEQTIWSALCLTLIIQFVYDINIVVYMDNCSIEGNRYAIVLRGSDGEHDNTVYISNSRIQENDTIRIDNDPHKLYIGVGYNFTAENTNRPAVVHTTDDIYKQN